MNVIRLFKISNFRKIFEYSLKFPLQENPTYHKSNFNSIIKEKLFSLIFAFGKMIHEGINKTRKYSTRCIRTYPKYTDI